MTVTRVVPALAVLAGLVLTGCSSEDPDDDPTSEPATSAASACEVGPATFTVDSKRRELGYLGRYSLSRGSAVGDWDADLVTDVEPVAEGTTGTAQEDEVLAAVGNVVLPDTVLGDGVLDGDDGGRWAAYASITVTRGAWVSDGCNGDGAAEGTYVAVTDVGQAQAVACGQVASDRVARLAQDGIGCPALQVP